MGDEMVIDLDESKKQTEKKVNRPKKRKRDSSFLENLSKEDKESRIDGLKNELEGLFKYFKEVSGKNETLEEMGSSCLLVNQAIACLIEESDLPFSKLVERIYEKVKMREGITLVTVRSSVLSVGQRLMYGVANADADVLEDSSEKCLWCWETRDMKLIPKAHRGLITVRRACRKKIQERISAVSAMVAAFQALGNNPIDKVDLLKKSEKLMKVLNEAEIRLVVEKMAQKCSTEVAEKEGKLKEKELVKEAERIKREHEKEKKRLDREHLKEKLQNEKEQKRLQDEAEKEERLREVEKRKQIRRQQEEAEKDQRRREKEEAQLKEQASLRKQATIMERFLKCSTKSTGHQEDPSSSKTVISDSPTKGDAEMLNAVTVSMDTAFSSKVDMDSSELYRLHFDAWNKSGRGIRNGNSRRWGLRQKPKTALIKELKLQGSSETGALVKSRTAKKGVCDDALNVEKVIDERVDKIPDDRLCHSNVDSTLADTQIRNRIKKLLQFDKSFRPAYYGTLSSKSAVIGPRHPFAKDPNLDYDVQSDEEWEEEDPGESLSDCDKDEEEEILVDGNIKADDEDGSEDGFLVPDGYLSENEGVQVDSMETDSDDDIRSSPQLMQDVEGEEFRVLFRQQKHINNLTEHALQKSQPLIVSNLMHEKTALVTAEDLNGTLKLEQMFLQALSLRPFPGGPSIDISINHDTQDEDQDVQESPCSGGNTPVAPADDLLEKDMSKIVSTIQSCPHGISKVIESLQLIFPTVSKTQLGKKVRELSEFVDNRWRVKKQVLDKLGFPISPEKSVRPRQITAFFSKRCLPPAGGPIKTDEMSPEQKHMAEKHLDEDRCIVNQQQTEHFIDTLCLFGTSNPCNSNLV